MNSILILFLTVVSMCNLVSAEGLNNTKKVKKSNIKTKDLKHIRATSSDQDYYTVELTAEELKIIEEARKTFAEGRKLPPPSQHMIDKMQDQIAPLDDEN